MDEKRPNLKAVLRELAAEDSEDAGPHAGSKRLIAYHRGTLPAAEREALQEHLSVCTRCTGLLRELRDFEAAAAGAGAAGPEPLRQEAWESLVRRLPHHPGKEPAVRPIATLTPPLSRRVPTFVYGAAAALLLAVAGLSVWAAVTVQQERQRLARLEQRLEERESALAAVRRSLAETGRQLGAARGQIQDLETERADGRTQADGKVKELETRVTELTSALEELRRTPRAPGGHDRLAAGSREIEISIAPRFALRGQEPPGFLRGGGAVNAVRTLPQSGRFTVALNLADHPVYSEYRLELLDRNGKVLQGARWPGKALLGDAGTSVSVSGLGPGLYRLRIEGLHPDRTELLAEYVLEVERQEAPK